MKKSIITVSGTVSTLVVSLLLVSGSALAAKSYQVTGEVVESSDAKIVVLKGKEKFEIDRAATTKVSGAAPAVGDKATVYYSMTATEIEAKGAAKGKKAK